MNTKNLLPLSKKVLNSKKNKSLELKDFDTNVRPQDDFYSYVNGGWAKRTSIPETESRWGSFLTLRNTVQKQLKKILADTSKDAKARGESKKISDLYNSVLNIRLRNKKGISELLDNLYKIEALVESGDLAELCAWLHIHDVDAPWGIWFDQDDKNSDRMVMRLGHGGIGVPDKEYYTKNTLESRRILKAYKNFIRDVLSLDGSFTSVSTKTAVQKITSIEKKIAESWMGKVDRRDAEKMYHKYTTRKLQQDFPEIDWKVYLEKLGISPKAQKHIIVDSTQHITVATKLLHSLSKKDCTLYLQWQYLMTYVGTLGMPYLTARFNYNGRTIHGLKKMPELWKQGVAVVNGALPDALSKLYVKKHFPLRSKKKIESLVKQIVSAYEIRIRKLTWMSQKTKNKACKKLNSITCLLGYPDMWESYAALTIANDSLTKNMHEAAKFHFKREVAKLDIPTNRREWFMSASTVNAYYSPNLNQIVFPAAILQPPFFNPDADDAINYGSIGAIIGHELTHGFDDSGSKFDEKGNLHDWWTSDDRKAFNKRTKVLVRQFNNYTVVGNIPVNGELTLGENIADLGGLLIAYDAFRATQKNIASKAIDGFTPMQRFFISHALSERELIRDEFLKFITLNDPHSPSKFRSNGPVSNIDVFYDIFNVQEGDALYRKPKDRVHIW